MRIGSPEAARASLVEARADMEHHSLGWHAVWLGCLEGELLLNNAEPDRTSAAACFQGAIATARSQRAKSLELRAAMALARVWGEQGERQKAFDLLAPIYGWFTEGFDTHDLREAKALLDQLA
jgi:predicted ATPase